MSDAVNTDHVKVINMSFGRTGSALKQQQDTINAAWSKGVIVVAAAGNDNSTARHYPAAYDHVISVGAIEPSWAVARTSPTTALDRHVGAGDADVDVGAKRYDDRRSRSERQVLPERERRIGRVLRSPRNFVRIADHGRHRVLATRNVAHVSISNGSNILTATNVNFSLDDVGGRF